MYAVKNSKRLLQMFVATRYATQIRSSSHVCRYSICDLEKVEFKCFEVTANFIAAYENYRTMINLLQLTT